MAPGRTEPAGPGVLLVDKPTGPTSHDMVDRARDVLREESVGHTGTLDPFASGLLLLCVGRATRLVRFFHPLWKGYRALVRLGVETETHDPEGEVTSTSDAWRELDRSRVASALGAQTGRIQQVPPAYSAKRVEGQRAYRAARRKEKVTLPAEEVHVGRLALSRFDPPMLEVEATVSTGTYLRGIARDLGRELECGAHLTELRRTEIGPFRVGEAWSGDRLAPEAWDAAAASGGGSWLPPAEALGWLPGRELTDDEARRVRHGGRIPRAGARGGLDPAMVEDPRELDGWVALVREGRLLAMAEADGDELQPRVVVDAA